MKTILILLGAPGAGKGTQASALSEKLNIPHISTGDLFRDNIRRGTELGKRAQSYIDKGQLGPDELVYDMLFDRLAQPDCARGYILDGFPRNIPQAEVLDKRLTSEKIVAVSLEVPDDVIVDRLTARVSCEQCGTPFNLLANPPKEEGICDRCGGALIHRKDDTAEVIVERLKIYHAQTAPVKAHYPLIKVDGTLPKEKIADEILSSLNQMC